MAELAIFMIDKAGGDVYKDAGLEKRGDVLAVRPDGFAWGKEELSLPLFRMVRAPGLSLDEAEAMIAPELPTDPVSPSKTLQKRAFRLDLDLLSQLFPDVAAYLADDTRKIGVLEISDAAAVDAIRGAKKRKPPIPDPNVIGADAGVIG